MSKKVTCYHCGKKEDIKKLKRITAGDSSAGYPSQAIRYLCKKCLDFKCKKCGVLLSNTFKIKTGKTPGTYTKESLAKGLCEECYKHEVT